MTSSSTLGKPGQMARPRSALVGREGELAHGEELLRRADVGLVALTGASDSGKTRLALAIAARQWYFADVPRRQARP